MSHISTAGSDPIATLRRYLVGLNAGGAAITVAAATALAAHDLSVWWIRCPVASFVAGLSAVAAALLAADLAVRWQRAESRLRAARYAVVLLLSLSLCAFLVGATLALQRLPEVSRY